MLKFFDTFCSFLSYTTNDRYLFCFRKHGCRGWRLAAVLIIKCNVLNMQDSIILPILYHAKACGPQIAYA